MRRSTPTRTIPSVCHTRYRAGRLKATHFSVIKGTKSMTALRLTVAEQKVHHLRQGLARTSSTSKSEAEASTQIAMLALLMMSGIRAWAWHSGKVFMRQLDETLSHSANISPVCSGELSPRKGGPSITLISMTALRLTVAEQRVHYLRQRLAHTLGASK